MPHISHCHANTMVISATRMLCVKYYKGRKTKQNKGSPARITGKSFRAYLWLASNVTDPVQTRGTEKTSPEAALYLHKYWHWLERLFFFFNNQQDMGLYPRGRTENGTPGENRKDCGYTSKLNSPADNTLILHKQLEVITQTHKVSYQDGLSIMCSCSALKGHQGLDSITRGETT